MSGAEFGFNCVRVIQALESSDCPTAHKLYDEVLLPASYSDDILTVSFEEVESRGQFLTYLGALAEEVITKRLRPILHIEAHGDRDGLELPNGDHIPWQSLGNVLRAINHGSRFNLLLVLGVCSGAHFVRAVNPTEPSPVWALIGPQVKIMDRDLLHAYRIFYRELLSRFDGTRALKLALGQVPNGIRDFGFYSAMFLFKISVSMYLAHCADAAAIRNRANRLMCRIVAERPELVDQRDEILNNIMSWIKRPEERFEEWKSAFFMYDQLPENRERFALTLDECLNGERDE